MMKDLRNAVGIILAALVLTTGAAQAQVNADDVWTAIVAQYGALGADLTATLTRDGAVWPRSAASAAAWPCP